MTKRIAMAVAVISIMASAGFAQLHPARQGDLAASIPFAFEVNGKAMLAGEYVIRADSDSGTLHVCEDGVHCASIPTTTSLEASEATDVRLVLRKIDGRLRLQAVECVDGRTLRLPDCESISNGQECERVAVPAKLLTITVIPGLGTSWS